MVNTKQPPIIKRKILFHRKRELLTNRFFTMIVFRDATQNCNLTPVLPGSWTNSCAIFERFRLYITRTYVALAENIKSNYQCSKTQPEPLDNTSLGDLVARVGGVCLRLHSESWITRVVAIGIIFWQISRAFHISTTQDLQSQRLFRRHQGKSFPTRLIQDNIQFKLLRFSVCHGSYLLIIFLKLIWNGENQNRTLSFTKLLSSFDLPCESRDETVSVKMCCDLLALEGSTAARDMHAP